MLGKPWTHEDQIRKLKRYLRGELAHIAKLRRGELGSPAWLEFYQVQAQYWGRAHRVAQLREATLACYASKSA